MTQTDRIFPGIALMLGFCAIAPLIDVASKLAAQAVPVGTITLGRFVVQAALMAPIVLAMRLPLRIGPTALRLTLARAFVSILATYSFVAAVQVMPIADALAIAFVEPFVILLIGRFVMGEEVGPRRLGASVVGFIGALFVIQPSFSRFGAVALFPLGTAVCFALYILLTRALSRQMHPVTMQLHTALAATVLCVPMLAVGGILDFGQWRFVPPQGVFWIWVFCVGLAATISHMSMTYALKFRPLFDARAAALFRNADRHAVRLSGVWRFPQYTDLDRRGDHHRFGALHHPPRARHRSCSAPKHGRQMRLWQQHKA